MCYIHLYKGLLFGNEKEWSINAFYNTDEHLWKEEKL